MEILLWWCNAHKKLVTRSPRHYFVLLGLYKCHFQPFMKFSSDNIEWLNKLQDHKEMFSKKKYFTDKFICAALPLTFHGHFLELIHCDSGGGFNQSCLTYDFPLNKRTLLISMHVWCAQLSEAACLFIWRTHINHSALDLVHVLSQGHKLWTHRTLEKDLFSSLIVLSHYSFLHSV